MNFQIAMECPDVLRLILMQAGAERPARRRILVMVCKHWNRCIRDTIPPTVMLHTLLSLHTVVQYNFMVANFPNISFDTATKYVQKACEERLPPDTVVHVFELLGTLFGTELFHAKSFHYCIYPPLVANELRRWLSLSSDCAGSVMFPLFEWSQQRVRAP